MSNPRAEITRERRRYIQVRKTFEVGLTTAEDVGPDFYLACAAYLVFSMDRLQEQDQQIHDRLAARIPAEEWDAHKRLAELQERQQKSRQLMARFADSMEKLRSAGSDGLQVFEELAREFTATFNSLMAPRKNPFHEHTDRLFTDSDWETIAGVTEQSLATEEQLYEAVRGASPPDIKPEEMTVEHS
jgi:hypothetical protein